jgi:hypothetical protein
MNTNDEARTTPDYYCVQSALECVDMSAVSNAVPQLRDRRTPRVNQLVFIRVHLWFSDQ